MARRVALAVALTLGIPAVASAYHIDPPQDGVVSAQPARDARVASALPRLLPVGLPLRWCGSPVPPGTTLPAPGPAFQLVYAHPSDTPDRISNFADQLQGTASYIDRFIAQASNYTKYLRFVMGTSCGADYVSIVDWTMPGARAQYVARQASGAGVSVLPNFTQIDTDAAAALGRTTGRNLLVYVDGLFGGRRYLSYGGAAEALELSDLRPGPENSNNLGGQFSYVWGATTRPPRQSEALEPDAFLHEASHAIGAVSYAAPHSTGAGHCTYVADIMCYADGGPTGAVADLVGHCGQLPEGGFGGLTARFDCSGDDYFNPAPAPGSYLADHWNTYNSEFMAPCSELAMACGFTPSPKRRVVVRRIFGRRRRIVVIVRMIAQANDTFVLRLSETGVRRSMRASLCVFPRAKRRRMMCTHRRAHARSRRPLTLRMFQGPSDGWWRTYTVLTRIQNDCQLGGSCSGGVATIRLRVALP